jgi:hypothetical protein
MTIDELDAALGRLCEHPCRSRMASDGCDCAAIRDEFRSAARLAVLLRSARGEASSIAGVAIVRERAAIARAQAAEEKLAYLTGTQEPRP